jgi:DNA-sulfur modification-associated
MSTYRAVGQKMDNGGLVTYSLALPIRDALAILEIPDPGKPFPGNRRVSKKHAMEFGNYWERERGNWIVPPILIDSETHIEADPLDRESLGGSFYQLTLPFENFGSLKILDGQHRILGWYLKSLEIEVRNSDLTSQYNRAVLSGEQEAVAGAIAGLEDLEAVAQRLENESIWINIIDALDEKRHQQFFVDIAKNALGINKTVQAKFDNSSVINRVAQFLIKTHPLLIDNVDLEKTTCTGSNSNLLSVVNVADIVRHATFGISARVTARKESIFDDDAVSAIAKRFFDVTMEGMPQLSSFLEKEISAPSLRENSLLGSGTIWRCLAGAYHVICVGSDDKSGEIYVNQQREKRYVSLLREISVEMSLPISKTWYDTGLFPNELSKAPSSRAQDLSSMVQFLANWSYEAD